MDTLICVTYVAMFELYIMYRVLVLIASFHKHIHICERAIIVKAAKIEVQSVKYCNYVFFFCFCLFICFVCLFFNYEQ